MLHRIIHSFTRWIHLVPSPLGRLPVHSLVGRLSYRPIPSSSSNKGRGGSGGGGGGR